LNLNTFNGILVSLNGVTGHRVTAQWSFAIFDPDFATVMDFGCALLSFIEGMHGSYFWKIEETHRA